MTAMRVLVVEDNVALADGVRRGLIAEGFDVDVTHDGLDGVAGPRVPVRRDRARHPAARDERLRDLPRAARRRDHHADHDAHRQGRRGRRGRGPRPRRRRLRHQAVLLHRARRPAARSAPPGQPDRATTGSWSATSRSTRATPVHRGRQAGRADAPRVRAARGARPPARRAAHPQRTASTWCGAPTTPACPTSSTSTSATSGARSTTGMPRRREPDRDGARHRLPGGRIVIRRLGIRARLTVLVTAVFAVATTIGAVAVVQIVQDRLVDDTRANAERILSEYLARIYGGTPAVPTVQPEQGTSFFYLDENGREMTTDYCEAILDVGFVQAVPPGEVIGRSRLPRPAADRQRRRDRRNGGRGELRVEPSTGVFVAATEPPSPIGWRRARSTTRRRSTAATTSSLSPRRSSCPTAGAFRSGCRCRCWRCPTGSMRSAPCCGSPCRR